MENEDVTAQPTTESVMKNEVVEEPDRAPVTETINAGVASAFATLNPLANRVSKSFATVKQLASERIGNAEKTEFSKEYLELETRVDRLKLFHENMIRLASEFVNPGASLKYNVLDAAHHVVDAINVPSDAILNEKIRSGNNPNASAPEQVLGTHFLKAGIAVDDSTPLGTALLKCGDLEEKLGKARLRFQAEIYEKHIKPLGRTLDQLIKPALIARKNANQVRLELDAAKSRLRSAKDPKKQSAIQTEIDDIQGRYDAAVENSLNQMRAVANSNEPLTNIADFVAAQLTFFETGYQLLAEVAPEIDTMKAVADTNSHTEQQ